MSNRKKAGRRSRILSRPLPFDVYNLRVEDDTAAQAELAAAREALEIAQLRTDDSAGQMVIDAQTRVEAARDAVMACYEPVTVTALEPKKYEALVAEHPAAEEGKAWGPEFPRVCFLACAPTGEDDPSVEEWEAILDTRMSQGEQRALYEKALGVNVRWPSGAVPNV